MADLSEWFSGMDDLGTLVTMAVQTLWLLWACLISLECDVYNIGSGATINTSGCITDTMRINGLEVDEFGQNTAHSPSLARINHLFSRQLRFRCHSQCFYQFATWSGTWYHHLLKKRHSFFELQILEIAEGTQCADVFLCCQVLHIFPTNTLSYLLAAIAHPRLSSSKTDRFLITLFLFSLLCILSSDVTVLYRIEQVNPDMFNCNFQGACFRFCFEFVDFVHV
jgi:hypothetical protein